MRTNRITLAAAAGATLAAGIATPAAAHTVDHHDHTMPTLTSSQARLAASTAREEAFLAQAKNWVAANAALSPVEKDALAGRLDAALEAIRSAAGSGAAATNVSAVLTADHTADQAFWDALRTVFVDSATITSAEHESATVARLQAKLAALVAQYTAHDVPASPAAAAAGALLATASGDATAARAAAISDPSTAARDLAGARGDVWKAVGDIAGAAHALAGALATAAPASTVRPAAMVVPKTAAKPASDPASTHPCAGHHVAVHPRGESRDAAYVREDHRADAYRHSNGHHGAGHRGYGSADRHASFHH